MLFTSEVCLPEILKQEGVEKKKTDDVTGMQADDI